MLFSKIPTQVQNEEINFWLWVTCAILITGYIILLCRALYMWLTSPDKIMPLTEQEAAMFDELKRQALTDGTFVLKPQVIIPENEIFRLTVESAGRPISAFYEYKERGRQKTMLLIFFPNLNMTIVYDFSLWKWFVLMPNENSFRYVWQDRLKIIRLSQPPDLFRFFKKFIQAHKTKDNARPG